MTSSMIKKSYYLVGIIYLIVVISIVTSANAYNVTLNYNEYAYETVTAGSGDEINWDFSGSNHYVGIHVVAMTEADYQKFVDLTSTVKLANQRKKGKDKEDDKAEVDMMLGTTRAFLIENLIVNWNVIGEDGKVLAVTPNNIRKLPPEIVKIWVDDIYEQNPILKNEEEDEGDKEITKVGGKLPKA